MKPSKRYRVRSTRIRSLQDIETEIQKLRLEIARTEANIQLEYHEIVNALTLKKLATSAVNKIMTTSTVISRAIVFGKKIMEYRKKKKKHRHDDTLQRPPENSSVPHTDPSAH